MMAIQYALRRRMMIAGGGGAPISDLPLGALINVGTDGGAGTPNYEIADINNYVSGGVVLVRKNIYSESQFGSNSNYSDSTLDNLIKTTIYNEMPQMLQDIMMDITLIRYPATVTRKLFALTRTMVNDELQLYTSNASRIKNFNDSAAIWWLSSKYDSERAWYVRKDGSLSYTYGWTSSKYGVVPAFVIPSETPYAPTPNTDGSYNLIL